MNSAISSKKPLYSVIIVTYNSCENIRVCLDSLRRCGSLATPKGSSGSTEIIVVDNNSRDETQKFLVSQSDIRVILNKENNGFSKGCNQGADIATGEYVVFLNPDTLVTPDWCDTMARYFQDPSVGAVGPVSNYVAGLQQLDVNLPPAWRKAKSFPGNGAAEISDNIACILKEANVGKGVITKLLIGFCLMMQRALFMSTGKMDENLFLGNDDLDLSWRLRNLGRKLVVASDAFIFHEGQKSFKTESKSVVDRLTQESTDALYTKLVTHYGGRDKVPSAIEMWGIGWFNPSPSLVAGPQPLKGGNVNTGLGLRIDKEADVPSPMKGEVRDQNAWKNVTVIVYVGPDAEIKGGDANSLSDASSRLDRTLGTLPARPGAEIIVLNCAGINGAPEAPTGTILRKLDLGNAFPIKHALDIALAIMPGSHGLFCMAGIEFSSMFNHWLDKRDVNSFGAALPLPLRIGDETVAAAAIEQGKTRTKPNAAYSFLCRKEWLKEVLASMPTGASADFLIAMNKSILSTAEQSESERSGSKPIDPPWLMSLSTDLPVSVAPAQPSITAPTSNSAPKISWTAVPASPTVNDSPAKAGDTVSLYPESLRGAMREATNIGFAGTNAEMPPVNGTFKVFDLAGKRVPLASQDLLILRLTPDLIEGLTARIANIRKIAPGLKRLITVFNREQAKGLPTLSHLAPVDLTPDGVRSALWGAGFAVTGERRYAGFGGTAMQQEILKDWTQVEAIPRSVSHQTEKMISIVILGFNQVAYTKKCIESIRKYTRQKYEFILVDNGSKDETESFFRSIAGAKVIVNKENLGVAKGWNQGMRVAVGDYILILNNDIIVGPDWLENMVRLAESDPSIGLVGPRSNYIAGPQVVPDVSYKMEAEIQPFISKWQANHLLSAAEFGFIKGFCHLIPRRVFDKVGFYDERFGKGNFEDDDYCMRVRHHGFRALFANDSFIHHYGSVSFNQESVDWRALMIENQRKYEQKWAMGASAVNDTFLDTPKLEKASPSDTLALGRAAYAEGSLERARALFLDSQAANPSDPETYCCLGALQFSQGALQDAVSLFMQCLNLDPTHEDAARNVLDTLASDRGSVSQEETTALTLRYPTNSVFKTAHAKQQPATLIPTSPLPVAMPERPTWTPVASELTAWRKQVETYIKSAQYGPAMDLLEIHLKANDQAAACQNYLGIIAHALGDADLALTHFGHALKLQPGDTDTVFNLADTLLTMGRSADAATLLEDSAHKTGVAWNPAIPDLDATAEQIRHAMGQGKIDTVALLASRDANQQAEKLLRSDATEETMAYLDAALEANPKDFRALNNLGLLAWEKGDGETAWNCFVACLEIRPTWDDALTNAFDTALAYRDIKAMQPLLDAALACVPDHAQANALRSHIQAQGAAIYGFKTWENLEANAALLNKAEMAMEQAKQPDAILIFLEAIEIFPQNPQAYNGLGIIAFGEKRPTDAFALFETAAAQHPVDQDILMNLWHCAQAQRREVEVLPKLRVSLEQNPALGDVKAIVKEFA